MKIRIAIIFMFFLYFFPLFLSPVVANGGEKPLVIAGDVNFPPVEYLVKNEPKGLNVELWQELSKAMNRKVEIQLMQWADAQKKVLNGEADALTLLSPIGKRKKLYDFSDTTLTFKFTLFVRNNDMTVNSLSDLDGKTVGVTKGGYPRQVLESKKQIKLFFIKNNLEGFRRLATHEINAVAAEAWVGAFAIQENGIKGIRMVEKPFATTQASIAVKKGNQKLLNQINLGIKKLKKDGIIHKIIDRWSPKEVVFFTREKITRIIIFFSFALLFAIIAAAFFWILMLRKQVSSKTKLLQESHDSLEKCVEKRTKEITKINVNFQTEVYERKRSEEALRESEEKFRSLFNNAEVGMFRTRTDGLEILDMNEKFLEIFCRTREEMKNLPSAIHWADPSQREEMVHRLELEGRVTNFECGMLNKHGEVRTCLTSLRLYREQGILEGSIIDITDRKQAEEILHESEERFRSTFEQAAVGIVHVTPDGRFLMINQRFCNIVGYMQEEMLTKIFQEITHPDDLNAYLERVQQLLENKIQTFSMEKRYIRKNGSHVWVNLTVSLVRQPSGEPKYFIGVIEDIENRKKVEEEKKKLEARLQQAQKMEAIGTLAGGIAHDFNNILFPIMGFAEMALDDVPKGSPLRNNIKEILQGTKRARDLVKQILAFSRQSGTELKPLKVQSIVKEVLKLMRSSLPTTIEIKQDICNECGLVMADATQIQQVAMNLMTNAYHAMEDEGGKLEVTLKEIELGIDDLTDQSMAPGTYVCLTVTDTGSGMDQAVIRRIFEPYFTTKEDGKGTGLGLAVVHGIVKSYEGNIRVYSELGEGTTFHVYLPVIKSQVETEETEAVTPVQKGTERILLVDDEEPIVSMETQMLKRLGYDVTERTSSIEALEAFRAAPDKFDLVITDMTMPNMTGIQLSQKLLEIRPDIPIIICTGFSTKVDGKKAKAFGIRGYVMKPVVMNEIAKKIREVLDQSKKIEQIEPDTSVIE